MYCSVSNCSLNLIYVFSLGLRIIKQNLTVILQYSQMKQYLTSAIIHLPLQHFALCNGKRILSIGKAYQHQPEHIHARYSELLKGEVL